MNLRQRKAQCEQAYGYLMKYMMDFQDALPDDWVEEVVGEIGGHPIKRYDELDMVILNISCAMKQFDELTRDF